MVPAIGGTGQLENSKKCRVGLRNSLSSGSSVLLPLESSTTFSEVEVLVFRGASNESSYSKVNQGRFLPTSNSCDRLRFIHSNPHWMMETMPTRKVMGDMLLLPTGDVLIINGASKGTTGYNLAHGPVLRPVLYRTLKTTDSSCWPSPILPDMPQRKRCWWPAREGLTIDSVTIIQCRCGAGME